MFRAAAFRQPRATMRNSSPYSGKDSKVKAVLYE